MKHFREIIISLPGIVCLMTAIYRLYWFEPSYYSASFFASTYLLGYVGILAIGCGVFLSLADRLKY